MGGNVIVTRDTSQVLKADRLILPGVGAFGKGIQELENHGLIPVLHRFVDYQRPLLGICLGMQLLMEVSHEFGSYPGLGLVSGDVTPFQNFKDHPVRIPHIGWNQIEKPTEHAWDHTLFEDLSNQTFVYFLHSFFCVPKNPSIVLSKTKYGHDVFCSALQQNHLMGCQFHPEKSGKLGLSIYKRFLFNT